MKKILSVILAIALFSFAFATPALAAGAPDGAKLFKKNCAVCHAGGGNTLNPNKTLSQADLTANGKDTLEAVVKQVTYGKKQMPRFKGRLKDNEIEAVATYVLGQAEAGW
ncbi:MAG: c-type cytochrome [Symploca sp. SIO1B1]|nr:c-type cytochrome [Symploca sp. SIO1C2]NER47037.1 c-type cytochrome [Symploca sp. SIO1A3]NER96469.1 c-type cytochrome [Symploca sp. SIO1B1]